MEQEFHEGSPSAPLEVFRSSQPPFAPLLRVDGVTEAPRPPGQLRSLPEARRLMQLTLPLRSFRVMRLEVGATAWPDAHLAVCPCCAKCYGLEVGVRTVMRKACDEPCPEGLRAELRRICDDCDCE